MVKQVQLKKKLKSSSPLRRRIRRKVRRHIGPRQEGLKPAFRDGLVFHSHVRVGKRGPKSETFPKGKPRAIVVTKFRTMKRGTHADYKGRARDARHSLIWFGKRLREKRHLDELPQIISLLKGDLKLVGLRPLPRQEYNKLLPELKKIYDEVGPGVLGLQYACKSYPATWKEFTEVCTQFHEMWKKNKMRAYMAFAKGILKNYKGKEISIERLV